MRGRTPGLWRLVTIAAALAMAACQAREEAGLACPILAPGGAAALAFGPSLSAFGGLERANGQLAAGQLAAHAVWVPAGATVRASVQIPGTQALAMAYGPRDLQGGYPACSAFELGSGEGAEVTVDLRTPTDAGAEHLVVVGRRPGEGAAGYSVAVRCVAGCEDAPPPCPTLADRGCPAARCDGELARDEDGCPTCTCEAATLCEPGRRAGPWGACVLPGCDCSGDDASPVCGADGQTWPSACAAACANVPVAAQAPCEDACPNLSSCEAPCFGLRALSPQTGCPGCDCAPASPATPADCAACPLDLAPVCGSDGVTYRNRCVARCAGARLLYPGSCADTCRAAPDGCTLDCAWGLVLQPLPDDPEAAPGPCLKCACAPPPASSCAPQGAPVCVSLPAFTQPVTVGAPCLAVQLGATDGLWGPCATACEGAADCPDGTLCRAADTRLGGRCVLDAPATCGCSLLHDPVCGADGATWPNACFAACAAVPVAHLGACCEGEAPACDGDAVRPVDTAGCPDPDAACAPPPTDLCREDAVTTAACAIDAAPTFDSACLAHAAGAQATAEWCAP